MRQRGVLFVAVAIVTFSLGCAGIPTFPDNDAPAVSSSQEFGVLVSQPDVYQGRAIRLAGRMVSVESTDEGTMIVAEWLPYPEPGEYGPSQAPGAESKRFTLLYPGTLDAMGSWHGNKFLVAGSLLGTKDMITLGGIRESVPYVEARCLHVWKTGMSEFSSDAPDIEQTGFPPLGQTYCTRS